MKIIKILSALFLFLLSLESFSTTHTVTAGNMLFTPSVTNAVVGDTIKWVWLNGIHTTTSVSVPAGATAWSSPLDSLTSFSYKITAAGQYSYQCNYHYLFGMTGTINATLTGIKPISNNEPDRYSLYQNFPNPFNPTTNIRFDIPVRSFVNLTIYSITGEEVETLVNNNLEAGTYSVDWDGSKFSSGVYFYKIEAPGFSVTKKLMLVK